MSREKHAKQAQTGVRAIASALGIQRHELGAFTKVNKEYAGVFPPYSGTIHPPQSDRDNFEFLSNVHSELRMGFVELESFDPDPPKNDVHHYTDNYKKKLVANIPVHYHFDRMPAELNFKNKGKPSRAKKRKIADDDVKVKLEALEAKENHTADAANDAESDDNEEEEEGRRRDDDEEQMSDDDYQEEDNDYIQNYFDNGEGYDMSDDNLDEDGGY